MPKISLHDATLVNIFGLVFFVLAAAILFYAALRTAGLPAMFQAGPDVATALHQAGRYESLREFAASCDKNQFAYLELGLRAKLDAYRELGVLALCALGFLAFNVWYLRAVRREMEALRATPRPAPVR